MGKNQKLTKENLLESTPESSDAEEAVKPPQKSVAKVADAKKADAAKAPEKKQDKPQKEVARKESSHSHKDESTKAPKQAEEPKKKDKAPKKEEKKEDKKEAKAAKKEEAAPKKDAKKKEEKPAEEAKLGKRDAPSKSAAPKKEAKVKELSDDSSDSEDEPAPKKEVKPAPKKEAKAAPKKEEKAAPVAVHKKSDTSAVDSKKASFHEADVSADKNKKVKPSAPAKAAPKKEEPSKINKLKEALKKKESSDEDEMEVEEDSDEMEVEESEESEEEKPKPRKASAEKAAPAQRKASAEKVAPAQAPAQFNQKPAFNRQENGNNSRFGPEWEVIVCSLPFSASESDIRGHFQDCPDIKFVKVMMGQDGRPRGKAFIKFSSEDGMNAALDLNGSSLGGRNIIVELTDKMKGNNGQGGFQSQNQGGYQGQNQGGYQGQNQGGFQRQPAEEAPENTNVMIKNLAFTVDEAKLQNVFSGCGAIKAVRVCKKEDGSSRGFGFVDFTSIESARNAIKKNDTKIDGRNIQVVYSMPRDRSAPRQGGNFGGGFGGGFGGRPGGRPGGNFGAEKKGNLTQFTGEAVELD